MKIALPTKDKVTIFKRTGQAPLFAVATIQNNNITNIEFRVAPEHKHTEGQHSHAGLINLISDCDLILVTMIGKHLRAECESAGIKIKTANTEIISDALNQSFSD